MKISKKVIFISVILLSMILILGAWLFIFSNRDRNVDKIKKELQGVRISKDTKEVIENVTVKVNGSLSKATNTFIFNGTLSLSNLQHSKDNDSTLVYGMDSDENGLKERGIISYPRNIMENGKVVSDFAMVHWVNTDSKLSYLVIANYEGDCINNPPEDSKLVYQGNDILVFPAKDAQEALKIIEEHQIDQKIFQITTLEDYKHNNDVP